MASDEVGEQLSAWGKAARIETRGRTTGRPAVAAVGFVEEPDGSLLIAAGSPETAWARNLEAEPRCRVTIEDATTEMEAQPLAGPAAHRAIVELILKYGTPAERLGRAPIFRLVPASPPPGDR
ncbi:MAG TPA: nitroreductase family deazaflavin-dependent oxidoreductase [Candidatus Limnocylindrales bacterium]